MAHWHEGRDRREDPTIMRTSQGHTGIIIGMVTGDGEVHMHTHTHTHTHTCIHTYIHTYIYVYTCMCMYVCMCVCVCVCVRVRPGAAERRQRRSSGYPRQGRGVIFKGKYYREGFYPRAPFYDGGGGKPKARPFGKTNMMWKPNPEV
jgi:hypothetical protein